MNLQDAIDYLQSECDSLTDPEKASLQEAIDVILGESSALTAQQAVDRLNDFYWDVTLQDRLLFGQSVFVVSYTVDPTRPSPFIRHG